MDEPEDILPGLHEDDDPSDHGPGLEQFADPACPTCHGEGFLSSQQGGFNRHITCPCVLKGRKIAAQNARILSLFGEGGAKMTIGTYQDGGIAENQMAAKVARNYVENFPAFREAGKGFALQGESGIGKTHLAAGTLIALIKLYDVHPFQLSVPEMMRLARKKFNDPKTIDVIDQAMEADVYLLDDIGSEYHRDPGEGMSWVDEQLFTILNHRLTNNLPTLYTTNLSKRQLNDRLDFRVASRLDRATLAFLPMKSVRSATAASSELRNLLLGE